MLNTILGFKQKMGAVYVKDRRFPVTWIKVGPCVVTNVKNIEKDGYIAVQLGAGSKKSKSLTKPLQNHLKNVIKDKEAPRYLKEIRVESDTELKVGDLIKVGDVLKSGDVVAITGISKGKGFAGVVKRWGFHGGPKTHGQSDRERAPGSIGQRTTPGRVYKGKKMGGRMGSDQVTLKNLSVIDVDEKENTIAVVGAVPGIFGGLLFIKKIGEGGVKVEKSEVETKSSADNKEEIKEAESQELTSETPKEAAESGVNSNEEKKENPQVQVAAGEQKEKVEDKKKLNKYVKSGFIRPSRKEERKHYLA